MLFSDRVLPWNSEPYVDLYAAVFMAKWFCQLEIFFFESVIGGAISRRCPCWGNSGKKRKRQSNK